jgi:hypothetical protein
VPPLTLTDAVPFESPWQLTGVALGLITIGEGEEIATVLESLHPLISETVILYVPGVRPVTVDVV